jgi:hypothetical protein
MTNYGLIRAVTITIVACFKMQLRMPRALQKITKKGVRVLNMKEKIQVLGIFALEIQDSMFL